MWTTEEAVDKALCDSEDFIQSLMVGENVRESDSDNGAEDDVQEIDVCRSDIGEDTGEGVSDDIEGNAEQDVLAGDARRSNIGGDFDEDVQNQTFDIDTFRERRHDKVRGIKAYVAEHKNMGLTFDRLEELEELSKALEEQWGRMEVAWDEAMDSVEDESVFTEFHRKKGDNSPCLERL